MVTRTRQSVHDTVVQTAGIICKQKGRVVCINPGSEQNCQWGGRYIDVIVKATPTADKAWVIEVETAGSVNDQEAKNQWVDYDRVYQQRWYLAVPKESEVVARGLLIRYGIQHCTVITWWFDQQGHVVFSWLP